VLPVNIESRMVGRRSSSGVGLVHERDLACNSGPLKLPTKRFVASLTLIFFPFQKFISKSVSKCLVSHTENSRESKVRLDDDIKSPRTDEAIGAREREAQLIHDFGNTYRCRS
jgi:hypothetical protein